MIVMVLTHKLPQDICQFKKTKLLCSFTVVKFVMCHTFRFDDSHATHHQELARGGGPWTQDESNEILQPTKSQTLVTRNKIKKIPTAHCASDYIHVQYFRKERLINRLRGKLGILGWTSPFYFTSPTQPSQFSHTKTRRITLTYHPEAPTPTASTTCTDTSPSQPARNDHILGPTCGRPGWWAHRMGRNDGRIRKVSRSGSDGCWYARAVYFEESKR